MSLTLKGMGVSSGNASGLVRIVNDASASKDFLTGEILVARMTDPTMVIMMSKAAAIVTDTGGMTCHAAIVSREMGIPCVVATKTATQVLKDGMKVGVDGKKGEVQLSE